MPLQVPEGVLDVDFEKYGLGVPAVLALVALAVFARAFTGIVIFYQMTTFGQFGVIVLLIVSAVGLWLSGYTYDKVDTSRWLKTEEEDKEELIDAEE